MNIRQLTVSALMAGAALAFAQGAQAGVIQTTGAGSAITHIDAAATFDNASALTDDPYVEAGMTFGSSHLQNNSSSCGGAFCQVLFQGFSGNFRYGVSPDGALGFMTISSNNGRVFTGLEFVADTGYSPEAFDFDWSAFLLGSDVGSGSGRVAAATILGFADAAGFDEITFTTHGFFRTYAPAMDKVNAQFLPTSVPEPITLSIFGVGLAGAFVARRRKKA